MKSAGRALALLSAYAFGEDTNEYSIERKSAKTTTTLVDTTANS